MRNLLQGRYHSQYCMTMHGVNTSFNFSRQDQYYLQIVLHNDDLANATNTVARLTTQLT